jgi:hypothetical protein
MVKVKFLRHLNEDIGKGRAEFIGSFTNEHGEEYIIFTRDGIPKVTGDEVEWQETTLNRAAQALYSPAYGYTPINDGELKTIEEWIAKAK